MRHCANIGTTLVQFYPKLIPTLAQYGRQYRAIVAANIGAI